MKGRWLKTIFFFLIYLIIHFQFLAYVNYLRIEQEKLSVANRLYTPWSMQVTQETFLEKQLPEGVRIFFEHDEFGYIRTMKQNGDWKPPMLAGDFLDSETDEKQAVVGREVAKHYPIGSMFSFQGEEFRVRGIFGFGFPSGLDNEALLNQVPVERIILHIVLDGDRQSLVVSLMEQFPEIVFTPNETEQLSRFDIVMNVHGILLLGSLAIFTKYLFFLRKNKEATVLYLLGYTKIQIFRMRIRELLPIFLLTLVFVHGMSYVTDMQVDILYYYLSIGLFAGVIALFAANIAISHLEGEV